LNLNEAALSKLKAFEYDAVSVKIAEIVLTG